MVANDTHVQVKALEEAAHRQVEELKAEMQQLRISSGLVCSPAEKVAAQKRITLMNEDKAREERRWMPDEAAKLARQREEQRRKHEVPMGRKTMIGLKHRPTGVVSPKGMVKHGTLSEIDRDEIIKKEVDAERERSNLLREERDEERRLNASVSLPVGNDNLTRDELSDLKAEYKAHRRQLAEATNLREALLDEESALAANYQAMAQSFSASREEA